VAESGRSATGGPSGGASGSSGNRARDHLANERTYLAWLRTAVGVLALAAAIARFGPNEGPRDRIAVAICAVLGVGMLAVGTARYYQVARDLEAGRFTMAARAPLLTSVLVLVAALIVVLFLV
jgi:putative membrane protein